MIAHIAMILAVVTAGGLFLMVTGRRQREQQRTRLDVNRELYQQRKLELVAERDDGLLTMEAFARANDELDKRFVTENSELEQVADRQMGNAVWVPAVVVMVAAVILYFTFGSWQLQRQADDALAALPDLGRKVMSDQSAQTTREELETFALGLRQRLAQTPDDNGMVWQIYARVMTQLGQAEQAVDAFEKALAINPSNQQAQLGYAQLLVNFGEEQYLAQAAQLLVQVLQQDPTQQEALSLLGLIAYQRGDWQQAQTAWQLLQDQIAPADERYAAIQQALDDVEQRLVAADASLTVTVSLAPELQDQVPAGGTLFVYITDPDGSRMPAAAVRQPVANFPITIELSDANAMLPEFVMSGLNRWQVMARISSDEQIEAAPGDLDAEPLVLEAGSATSVQLEISKIVND
ncbi:MULTISPECIES: c-type cytochrome biogenesis protein CcmI [Idiomarinaceae]|uniref:Cytochrome c-type biogenesis protein CcmI n=2 Tax=Pseudidiomarina TaxID=2800384 RepID=A0A368V607_9GAMM|nr:MULTISPECIES: c-type cytochrome biogenesis protein CcmI [Idiomarinaceae]MRJ41232.1 c-type cytochrome biogenesis protein CcmI [Idiomarina sp. FeN1]NCU56397.1 c-type cytochrome biogenesis protein CcmI [Idiomarina sp. FenA--70]NCU59416.1 c-type cytochrome biogenesis protein CcmI [Idiomarina sp. FenBw--71]PWW16190.1 cytochrome c-type biogenesis protein CcmI [Pseudidiomarina maritima]RBP93300.1 cytochrome c-type biogenesis protein CcmI [Pseudidiomarina tainanensis]